LPRRWGGRLAQFSGTSGFLVVGRSKPFQDGLSPGFVHTFSVQEPEETLPDPLTVPDCPSPQQRSTRLRRAALLALASVFLALAGVCWIFRGPWFTGNLAPLDPPRVFRSAQPGAELGQWIERYGLRSVLNLRGGDEQDWWYKNEVQETGSRRVDLYDLPLSATRRPSRRELLCLIDVLERCRYPLLIHCKSGADRTGMASAIYLMLRQRQSPDEAERAFSLEFGHVPLFGPEHLHEPLREYGRWLKERGLGHEPGRFRDWVKNEYEAADPKVDPPLLQPGPRERRRSVAQGSGVVHSG